MYEVGWEDVFTDTYLHPSSNSLFASSSEKTSFTLEITFAISFPS
jgi:hypothetical protein